MSFWRTTLNKVVLIKTEAFKEAAEYSNIGINKIAEMLRNPMCNFVLYIGNKKLVKRKEFEQYLSTVREI